MKSFPMFINVADKPVAVVGGGEQAAQKTRLLLKTEAKIMLVADKLDDELAQLVAAGRATHRPMRMLSGALTQARIVFVASGCAGADAASAAMAQAHGVLANVVDRPDLCDLTTPAIVDRDPLVVAIGTEGAAPVLARQVKTRIEEMLEPRLGELTALAGRLRGAVAQKIPRGAHRAFWRWVFAEAPRKTFAAGQETQAAEMIKAAIDSGGEIHDPGAQRAGVVSLVGAGPGAADLITLRGVQRMQEADVIFYDRLVDARILELARRDAERVFVGKHPGGAQWPQDRINGVIVAAAREGKRVVRLKSGDPLIFGRAQEETVALDEAGVSWEIIPGVTSALAAAAQAKFFPTTRGGSQHLTLATGASAAGAQDPDFTRQASPGATTAYYMCVANAGKMSAQLLEAGAPSSAEVIIAENAETPQSRCVRATLGDLEKVMEAEQVKNPAILFVTWPDVNEAKREEA